MTEYEYKEKCQKINEQIKPSDEFAERMKTNIEQELQNRQNKQKCKFQKVAASFIAITLLSTGAVAFADDIGNLFTKIFKNSDPSVNLAIENGYIQNVEMDYIEHDGIGIKVNSIIVDENKLDIILDVKGEIDGDIYFKDIYIKGKEYKKEINSNNLYDISSTCKIDYRSIDKLNHMIIIKVLDFQKNLKEFKNLEIVLDTLSISLGNITTKKIENKWNYSINIDSDLFTKSNNKEFFIEENKRIKNYNIEVNDTFMNLKVKLKEDILINEKISRENIIIEDENKNKYNCKEFSRIHQDEKEIELNIPLIVYNKINKFKIFINLENEIIELNVEKQKD